ncbi:hypothetical protein CI610_03589 [invertebrate metagenome]|uniref:Uncharacterized protein n=1 Tax=invertebrate metagenome TaxID=1711999 RepID=A0A2H9T2R6_9ZZZZ
MSQNIAITSKPYTVSKYIIHDWKLQTFCHRNAISINLSYSMLTKYQVFCTHWWGLKRCLSAILIFSYQNTRSSYQTRWTPYTCHHMPPYTTIYYHMPPHTAFTTYYPNYHILPYITFLPVKYQKLFIL